jgi:hypothetical protein
VVLNAPAPTLSVTASVLLLDPNAGNQAPDAMEVRENRNIFTRGDGQTFGDLPVGSISFENAL